MSVHAFTSFSYSYLNRARVLARTLRALHPDWILWAVVTDKEPDGFTFDLGEEDFDRILTAEDLFGAETERWLFGHDVVEACTAVKGKASVEILAQRGCEKVVYFDPDIAVINGMDEVIDLLDTHSIVLTPHQTDPEPRDRRGAIQDNEIASLNYGVFNLGFVATRAKVPRKAPASHSVSPDSSSAPARIPSTAHHSPSFSSERMMRSPGQSGRCSMP